MLLDENHLLGGDKKTSYLNITRGTKAGKIFVISLERKTRESVP